MGQVSMKLRRTEAGYAHWCPGCNRMHVLPSSWTFDGNLDAPTYSPSFKHTCVINPAGRAPFVGTCHYILTAGVLNYCGDCDHSMIGRSVALPDLPPEYRDN